MFNGPENKELNTYLTITYPNGPCEDMFEYLAQYKPNHLIKLLGSNDLKYIDLTFAAEIAGMYIRDEKVLVPLARLMIHDYALVREGAYKGVYFT
jgi:hypothetical protein